MGPRVRLGASSSLTSIKNSEAKFMQNSQRAIADSSTKSKQKNTNLSLVNTSQAGRLAVDDLVPSRYALKVGAIDVMVVSDGVLSLPGEMLGHNADPAVRAAWLKDKFLPPDRASADGPAVFERVPQPAAAVRTGVRGGAGGARHTPRRPHPRSQRGPPGVRR